MNALDTVLQKSFPSVMVPRSEAVEPMTTDGERLLTAANGIWLEVQRPWIRVVRRIARYDVATAIPYGEIAESTELLCGAIPAEHVAAFYRMAHAALPNEAGAWIVWNRHTGQFRTVSLPSLSHGPGHLRYERPLLDEGESVVVDCHSHGSGDAFFSRTDNDDDRHDVKLALVLGNCDRSPSTAFRLCVKGIFEKQGGIPGTWHVALKAEVTA
ncbi:PRTRC genetic system protein A [Paraburkholderia sp. BL6669N2]|uniref:PRTRC system protein A n=1 Tax=Paraburkholderia sp. BL6669N2 TaxID=1938807 RepID=UPI000E21EB82|nr:PRTRC system protein A [Paraburkholderia sp. BL6669N2]REG45444.1 PRTRC genetic system protein A [Paraburkholderia sp. BL6669N2]